MRFSLFLWLFLCTTLSIFCINIIPVHSQCLDHQRILLLQLKDSLKFNSSLSNKPLLWDHLTDCCEWGGVRCDNVGHVIGLDLRNESISGGIHNSSSIFGLRYLQSLNLADNNFNSTHISSGFEKLTSLTYLNLSHANFAGEIPIGISRLTRLNLTELTELHLDFVKISSTGEEWCEAISSSLPNLQVLRLAHCDLSGPLCSSLENLLSLSVIDLSVNNMTGPVPNFFANFTNLTELSLRNCNLHGTFPEKIFHISTLRTLDLWSNELLEGSLPEFSQNGSLQTLYLISTKFSGRLPISLGNLRMLSTLDLYECSFSGPIPSSIANLTQLVHLGLSWNMLTGPIPSFSMSNNLTRINLSNNNFTGVIPFSHFDGLSNLEAIDLRNNSLKGGIPSSLFELPSLKVIQLSLNSFDGQVEEFSNASASLLESIDLSSNNLQGRVPMSFFELGELTELSLSSNNFSGLLQLETVYKLSNLTTLDLSYNSLSIGTSGSISSLSSIPLFKFGFLQTAKTFPSSCALQTLDLSGNQLEGRVPISLSNCTSLEVLNLGKNKISDRFPCFLENTSSIRVLVLRSNRFQGDIGCQGGNENSCLNLQIIDLAFNNFSGDLPSGSFSNWKTMMIDKDSAQPKFNQLGFQYGNMYYSDKVALIYKGLEVELVKVLTICTSIDFSSNRFEPDAIGNLKSLVLLNLSHNALTGSIPASLGNLKELKALDLSQNMLSGMIPTQLASLTFLAVLNVSYNLLVGKIPTGSQFQTFSETSFQGNKLLCGFPLNTSCNNTEVAQVSPPTFEKRHSLFETEVYLSVALGFIVGLAIISGHLCFVEDGSNGTTNMWIEFFWEENCREELSEIQFQGFSAGEET
ncbi:receptor-like protein Cf-9 [Cornus florida]|uniref:receptor-like protein Cf-9 n=1 Tax=Cornus florida TaxID=4283 RepID=UPI00289DD440|nr:receptor-like protein Cf-9 [Cornus florida]